MLSNERHVAGIQCCQAQRAFVCCLCMSQKRPQEASFLVEMDKDSRAVFLFVKIKFIFCTSKF